MGPTLNLIMYATQSKHYEPYFQLPEPLIPYNIKVQEEVIELCAGLSAFSVSFSEHKEWLVCNIIFRISRFFSA